jgi:alkanesulfonate monooxygenase SsuD/methylene tetrahydromethanopterin reductase-like flavin-dependent oxidoreductase (luciferase family)
LAGEAQISVQHPIGLAHDESDREKVIARAERRFGTWGGLISGTPSEITDALRAEVAKGVRGFVLQFDDFGTPETVARFMNEVAPEVQAGVGA